MCYTNDMRYAIWNNKGGVGKTFLTFALSTEYAERHPDKNVVVIDMCPQANASEILLGGNGAGSLNTEKLINNKQTIGGYFDKRIASPHVTTGDEATYLINVHKFNSEVPENVSLVVGDPSLELQIQTINNIAVQELPEEAWKNVHSWVIDIENAAKRHYEGREVLFIIDCNPSFSSYTEQAILAADRLIVPCTPDGSSSRAITNLSRLLYGYDVPTRYINTSFHTKAKKEGMLVPKMHLVLLNKSTEYSNKPARAFQAMLEQVKQKVRDLLNKNQQDRSIISVPESSLFKDMPDAHTVAIVSSSLGKPLYSLKAGPHALKGGNTSISPEPLDRYKKAIREIVENL